MEKMLFSGVQSNSDVALIVIKGLKHQPGIAAKIFGSIADEKINVELILQSIGRGPEKDISFVVAQEDADKAVETLKKANENLISTMKEAVRIQQEGHDRRQAAEQELMKIEEELKQELAG